MGFDVSQAEIERMLRQQGGARMQPVVQQIDPVTPVLLKEMVESSRTFAEQVMLYAMKKDGQIAIDLFDLLYGVLWPIQSQMIPFEGFKGVFCYVYLSAPTGVFRFAQHYQPNNNLIDESCFTSASQKIFDKLFLTIYEMFIKNKSASYELLETALIDFADSLAKEKKQQVETKL